MEGFIGYKMGSLIRGWKIELAHPECAGALLLEKFSQHTRDEIRNFFLNNIVLTPKHPRSISVSELYEQNWVPGHPFKFHGKDDSAFIRDPILCEFGYVFNIECHEKHLHLFTGFGYEPSPGYEQYQCLSAGKLWYMNEVAILTGPYTYAENYIRMLAYMYHSPLLVEALFPHQHAAIIANPMPWVSARTSTSLGPSALFAIREAVLSYAQDSLVPPSGEKAPEDELKPIERPRRVLWR